MSRNTKCINLKKYIFFVQKVSGQEYVEYSSTCVYVYLEKLCLEFFLIHKNFLVLDPRMIGEIGGDLLFTKITWPHKALMENFGPGLFKTINKGSLIICDNTLLETLQLTVTRAVED